MSVLIPAKENETAKTQLNAVFGAPVVGRPQTSPQEGPVQNMAGLKTVVQGSSELNQPNIVQVEGIDARHPDQDDADRNREIAKNLNQLDGMGMATPQNVEPPINQTPLTVTGLVENLQNGADVSSENLNGKYAKAEVVSPANVSTALNIGFFGKLMRKLGIAPVVTDIGQPTAALVEGGKFADTNNEKRSKIGLPTVEPQLVPAEVAQNVAQQLQEPTPNIGLVEPAASVEPTKPQVTVFAAQETV